MGILKTSVAAIAAISCTQPGCPPLETKTDVAAANNRAPVATVIPPAAGGNAGEPDALDDEDAVRVDARVSKYVSANDAAEASAVAKEAAIESAIESYAAAQPPVTDEVTVVKATVSQAASASASVSASASASPAVTKQSLTVETIVVKPTLSAKATESVFQPQGPQDLPRVKLPGGGVPHPDDIMKDAVQKAAALSEEQAAMYNKAGLAVVDSFTQQMKAAKDIDAVKKILDDFGLTGGMTTEIDAAVEGAVNHKVAFDAVKTSLTYEGIQIIAHRTRGELHVATAAIKAGAIKTAASIIQANSAQVGQPATVPANPTITFKAHATEVPGGVVRGPSKRGVSSGERIIFRDPKSDYYKQLERDGEFRRATFDDGRQIICPREGESPADVLQKRSGSGFFNFFNFWRPKHEVIAPRECRQCNAQYLDLDKEGFRICQACEGHNVVKQFFPFQKELEGENAVIVSNFTPEVEDDLYAKCIGRHGHLNPIERRACSAFKLVNQKRDAPPVNGYRAGSERLGNGPLGVDSHTNILDYNPRNMRNQGDMNILDTGILDEDEEAEEAEAEEGADASANNIVIPDEAIAAELGAANVNNIVLPDEALAAHIPPVKTTITCPFKFKYKTKCPESTTSTTGCPTTTTTCPSSSTTTTACPQSNSDTTTSMPYETTTTKAYDTTTTTMSWGATTTTMKVGGGRKRTVAGDETTTSTTQAPEPTCGDSKPAEEKPAEEKPAEEKPAEEEPAEEAVADDDDEPMCRAGCGRKRRRDLTQNVSTGRGLVQQVEVPRSKPLDGAAELRRVRAKFGAYKPQNQPAGVHSKSEGIIPPEEKWSPGDNGHKIKPATNMKEEKAAGGTTTATTTTAASEPTSCDAPKAAKPPAVQDKDVKDVPLVQEMPGPVIPAEMKDRFDAANKDRNPYAQVIKEELRAKHRNIFDRYAHEHPCRAMADLLPVATDEQRESSVKSIKYLFRNYGAFTHTTIKFNKDAGSEQAVADNAELNKDAEDMFFRAADNCEKDVDDCLDRWVEGRDPKAENCINTLFAGAENVDIDVELKDPKEVIEPEE